MVTKCMYHTFVLELNSIKLKWICSTQEFFVTFDLFNQKKYDHHFSYLTMTYHQPNHQLANSEMETKFCCLRDVDIENRKRWSPCNGNYIEKSINWPNRKRAVKLNCNCILHTCRFLLFKMFKMFFCSMKETINFYDIFCGESSLNINRVERVSEY